MTRTFFLLGIASALLCWPSLACAADPVAEINANRKNLALGGYDAVAYFELKKPTKGSGKHTTEWNGATWRFSSTEHRDLFIANPTHYAPQYGGYCAWAVSNGYTADADPTAWTVREDKLYLNYNKSVQKGWLEEVDARIKSADANWPNLHR